MEMMNIKPVTDRYVIILGHEGETHGIFYLAVITEDDFDGMKMFFFDIIAPKAIRDGLFPFLWDREENCLLYASNIDPRMIDPEFVRYYLAASC